MNRAKATTKQEDMSRSTKYANLDKLKSIKSLVRLGWRCFGGCKSSNVSNQKLCTSDERPHAFPWYN